MRTILVIGSGAREVKIIQKLTEDALEEINIICIKTQENDAIDKHCFKVVSMYLSMNLSIKIGFFSEALNASLIKFFNCFFLYTISIALPPNT